MKKIIIFTIIAIITFSWLVTHNTTESEKIPPANTPFIIKSNVLACARSAPSQPLQIPNRIYLS